MMGLPVICCVPKVLLSTGKGITRMGNEMGDHGRIDGCFASRLQGRAMGAKLAGMVRSQEPGS